MKMNNLVIICAILLLVLLFLKVPVYIAVLSASAVYFIGTPGMNPVSYTHLTFPERPLSLPRIG